MCAIAWESVQHLANEIEIACGLPPDPRRQEHVVGKVLMFVAGIQRQRYAYQYDSDRS